MHWLFFVFALCAIVAIPIHFASVEHTKLDRKHGKEGGTRIGEVYGRISAYLLFASLIGLWFSPQPRFTIPILRHLRIGFPGAGLSFPAVHIVLFAPFVFFGALLLSRSVSDLTRKVSEAHRPDKIVTEGSYAWVRHPQYLGFLLTHIGFSLLMSAVYSITATPFVLLLLYCFARKEEIELSREFGNDEYDAYRQRVPILIPGLHTRRSR